MKLAEHSTLWPISVMEVKQVERKKGEKKYAD